MTSDDLAVIEDIKQLKARYFRYMDRKRWDDWGQVFTEDAVLVNPTVRDEPIHGRAEIVARVSGSLGPEVVTVHHGHMPEIELLGPDTARGVWAMYDRLFFLSPGGQGRAQMEGYGHYLEQYRLEADGQWRIAHLYLSRLHMASGDIRRDTEVPFWN